MAARWGLLLAACLLWCTVLGVPDPQTPATAQWLIASSGVALLAPLFWPGSRGAGVQALASVAGWSLAALAVAVLALLLLGAAPQRMPMILTASAMLFGLLLVAHLLVLVLVLAWRWQRGGVDGTCARERAGRAVALGLALLGAIPLWCGPAAELLLAAHAGAVDATVGLSPLTHLAVASGNDLLRNDWLYRHSNLAALQFDYPAPALLAGGYIVLAVLLGAVATTLSRHRMVAGATRIATQTEKTE